MEIRLGSLSLSTLGATASASATATDGQVAMSIEAQEAFSGVYTIMHSTAAVNGA